MGRIELHNASGRLVDLVGWEIASGSYRVTIDASLRIPIGGYAVVGPPDAATNGGVAVDWGFDYSELTLSHSEATVALGGRARAPRRLEYTGAMVPGPASRCSVTGASTAGRAWRMTSGVLRPPTGPAAYRLTRSRNDGCPAAPPDLDGDGLEAEGDCDDGDAR